jgi:D-alanyl-D-alanine carboxypeptidase
MGKYRGGSKPWEDDDADGKKLDTRQFPELNAVFCKTGYTNLARKTYVGAAQRGNRRLVVVQVYGTGDLYGQAIGLFDWGFGQSG